MPATARIPVQVSPKEKQAFTRKAKSLGMTVSELARTAMTSYVPTPDDEKDLERLIEQVKRSTEEAGRSMDDALAFVKASNRRLARIRETADEKTV